MEDDEKPAAVHADQAYTRNEPGLEQDIEDARGVTNAERGAGDLDPNLVSWDGPDDPENPVNWSATKRWTLITLVTSVTLVAGLSSSIFAPGIPSLMKEFGSTNEILGSFVVTIYVLGLATGPIFFAPLSELYGRLPIQHVGNVGFLVWTIACALATSLDMLIVFRLIQGIFAAVPLTNGGGVIADTVRQEERGFALAMFTFGLLAGPVIGPVCGGFLTAATSWRWSFWLSAILLALPTALTIPIWRETYPPILLGRKAARLRKATGNTALRTKYDSGLAPWPYFKRGIKRAMKFLLLFPVVTAVSVYMGLMYSYFYLLITTITPTFENVYHFRTNIVGLAYLGLGAGYFFGPLVFAVLSDPMLKRKAAREAAHGGEMKPEYRLPLAVVGGISVPIAFFWYGWSAQARTHWIVPIIGPAFLGFGNSLIFMSTQAYLVDAYTVIFAASALAATTIMRSVMAAVLPLAAPRMYAALGIGWGNSLLAFLALACLPVPFLLLKYGQQMRSWNASKMKGLWTSYFC